MKHSTIGSAPASPPPRVLCVDDEPNVLHALRRALGRRFAVTTATSGEAGLNTLRTDGPFAVVVSDMRMPGMNGAVFLGRVRAHAPDTARILLTGHSDVETAAAAVNEGQLFRFLTKPCGPDTLRLACDAGAAHHARLAADATARQALEAELARRISRDALTGLPNRARFGDAVARALAGAPDGGGLLAVLVLDLDNFRTVNDSLGHGTGDHLLVLAAERLTRATRVQDIVARLGGDEFAVLIEAAADVAAVAAVAGRITAAFADPFSLGGTAVCATASVGIAIAPRPRAGAAPTTTPEALLRDADAAMYRAKADGKGRVALFEPAMHAAVLVRLQLEADLRCAVDRQEFTLVYQPIVRLETRALAGLESLVRWRHPERGMLGPAAFIPAAEDTGLIVPLGRWVLQEACRQLREWQRVYEADAPTWVTVNVSGRQLHGADGGGQLVADVRAALDASGLAPAALVLEITESTAMQHTDATLATLAALKALGVRLAIDDFGTGYSSLAYLERFPLDVIKIDKSFVDRVTVAEKGPVLARAIVALGDALGLRTVAEGIECAEQADALRALGCRFGQGFLFARPLVPAEVEDLLRNRGVTGSSIRSGTTFPV